MALVGPVALHLGPVALNPLLGGTGLHLPPLSAGLLAGAALQLAVRMVLSSEQLAWSGFALPRMQARMGAQRDGQAPEVSVRPGKRIRLRQQD